MGLPTERLLTSVNKKLFTAAYWIYNDLTQALGLTDNFHVQLWVSFTCDSKTRRYKARVRRLFPVALHFFLSDLFCYSLMLILQWYGVTVYYIGLTKVRDHCVTNLWEKKVKKERPNRLFKNS